MASNKPNTDNSTIPIHHKINMRNIVMRQTDYDEDTADTKLEEHKYDVMNVVREFLNPNSSVKKTDENIKVASVNQQIYGEIRGMMDNASWNYRKRKEEEEAKELLRQEYIRRRNIAKTNLVSNINTKIEE